MKSKILNQVTDSDIKLLKVFRAVAESGSFSAAESALGITRSAISLHMSTLENRLGMRLCQRGRSGFALTDEGKHILSYSEALLTSIEDFRQHVNRLHHEIKGELKIGIINNLVTLPQMQITHALSQLYQKGPNIQIHLSMSTPIEIEKGLMDGQLHVGALPMISPLSGLEYNDLYEEASYLYCSHGHALFHHVGQVTSAEQLKNWDAVVPNYRLSQNAIEMQQALNAKANASDREGIAFLILTGKFIGFLPEHYAKHWVERGMMRAVLPEEMYYFSKICIATRKGRRANFILDLFLQELKSQGVA